MPRLIQVDRYCRFDSQEDEPQQCVMSWQINGICTGESCASHDWEIDGMPTGEPVTCGEWEEERVEFSAPVSMKSGRQETAGIQSDRQETAGIKILAPVKQTIYNSAGGNTTTYQGNCGTCGKTR